MKHERALIKSLENKSDYLYQYKCDVCDAIDTVFLHAQGYDTIVEPLDDELKEQYKRNLFLCRECLYAFKHLIASRLIKRFIEGSDQYYEDVIKFYISSKQIQEIKEIRAGSIGNKSLAEVSGVFSIGSV